MPTYRITKGTSTRTANLSIESANSLKLRGYMVMETSTSSGISGSSIGGGRGAVYQYTSSGMLRALPAKTTYGKTVMYIDPTATESQINQAQQINLAALNEQAIKSGMILTQFGEQSVQVQDKLKELDTRENTRYTDISQKLIDLGKASGGGGNNWLGSLQTFFAGLGTGGVIVLLVIAYFALKRR